MITRTRELEDGNDDDDDDVLSSVTSTSSAPQGAADAALVDGNGRGDGVGEGGGERAIGRGKGEEGEGDGRGSRSSSAVGRKKHGCYHCCTSAQLCLRSYFTHFATMHETCMMLVSFANIWVLTLYAHAHGFCGDTASTASTASPDVSAGVISNATANGANGANTVNVTMPTTIKAPTHAGTHAETGYRLDGCFIDGMSMAFVAVWWVDVLLRIVAFRWGRFYAVADDFYTQLKNQFDFALAAMSFILVIVGGASHLQGTKLYL